MAQQPAPARPRTYAFHAARHAVATNAPASTIDPVDVVAMGHPHFSPPHYKRPCTTIWQVNCAESVLRLANALVESKSFQATTTPEPLRTRAHDGLTISSMVRRVQHLNPGNRDMTSFPVYTLDLDLVGPPGRQRPNFILVHGIPRADKAAIVYMPPMPLGLIFPQAHWTFTVVDHDAETIPLDEPILPYPNTNPVMIYTDAPIQCDYKEIFWRCKPTAANMRAYEKARAYKPPRACHCCWMLPCPHEVKFYFHNWSRKVDVLTLCSEMLLNGAYRCTVLPDSDPCVMLGAERRVHVSQPPHELILHNAWNNEAMRRPYVEFGDYQAPFEQMGWFVRAHPLLEHLVRARRTLYETLWPCYWWKYDMPLDVSFFRVAPFNLEGRLYPTRVPMYLTMLLRFARTMLSISLIYYVRQCLSGALATYINLTANPLLEWLSAASIQRHSYFSFTTPVRSLLISSVIAENAPETFVTRILTIASRWIAPAPDLVTQALSIVPEVYVAPWLDDCRRALTAPPTTFSLFKLAARQMFRRSIPFLVRTAHSALTALPAVPFLALNLWTSFEAINRFGRAAVSLGYGFAARTWRRHYFHFVETVPAQLEFCHLGPTLQTMPRREEFLARMAMRQRENITPELVIDLLRRHANATNYAFNPSPVDVELLIQSIVQTPGKAPQPAMPRPGYCITCNEKRQLYRQECRICKHARRHYMPIYMPIDCSYCRIGRVGLWSEDFVPPPFTLKDDVKLKNLFTREQVTCPSQSYIMKQVKADPWVCTSRGFNAGPAFLAQRPKLFPDGQSVALLAFCVRLGVSREHQSDSTAWLWMAEFFYPKVYRLDYESDELFLSHFHGKKLALMLEAAATINAGDMTWSSYPLEAVRMGGFRKTEKSYARTHLGGLDFESRPTLKPRFICAPKPEFNYFVGPHTHAQLKWLAKKFHSRSHMFYAGCASPADLNDWLNWTLEELPDPVTLTDDIVAIDSNHSHESFQFSQGVFDLQFPTPPPNVRELIESEQYIRVRFGKWVAEVIDVNASGVPDTSWKNGVICLPARVLAIAFAVADLDNMSSAQRKMIILLVLSSIFTSAAGDDGLTRMPRHLNGVDVLSPAFSARYQSFWRRLGFSVKVAFYPEQRWRLATYLAARPVWAGTRYEWAPEPARRLRGAFWLYDQSIHPTAWARGIATQLLQQGAHQPVISAVSAWYLSVTSGPTASVAISDNPMSPWHDYQTSGVQNDRADREFCVDYSVSLDALDSFRRTLFSQLDPLITINHFVIERVYNEES